jgi:hypothetical protein
LLFNTTAQPPNEEPWVPDSPPGYLFLFAPGTADTTGATGQYGNVLLWGLSNGGLNALPVSPEGGYFITLSGDFQTTGLVQTLTTGLVEGRSYILSFYWGAAQQYGFNGDTQQNLTVFIGPESFTTPTVTDPSHGFTGWFSETYTFTDTSNFPEQPLLFLAYGSEPGSFITLDGVSLISLPLPEPSTWAMMLLGFVGLGYAGYRRTRGAAALTTS